MRKRLGIWCVALALLGCSALAACGGGAGDSTRIEFRCSTNNFDQRAYITAVNAYNKGQGKTDGVYVNAAYNVSSGGASTLLSASGAPSVVCVSDSDFKGYAALDYLLPLDAYMTDEAKSAMKYDEIPEILGNRFRYDAAVDPETGTKTAGKGQPILGLPMGGNPCVLFYNEEMLKAQGINIVSVSEEELASYNTANGTSLKARGYAEYLANPGGATFVSSQNMAGDTVYKVFNNKISMNWEEFRYLCKYLQTHDSDCSYPYMSEYWFEYAWSVGGDCVAFDEAAGKYVFTLEDKKSNYLALTAVTVNGTDYQAGDILNYSDKQYLHEHESEIGDKFYELPSTYDAFLEFNRYGVGTDKTVDVANGKAAKGYGLANSTINTSYFRGGTSAFLSIFYSNTNDFATSSIRGKFGIAPQKQFKVYEGGTLVDETAFDNIQVKVIGKEYGGNVYTGEIKKDSVYNTEIVGKYTTASLNTSVVIAKNSDPAKYEKAFKFVSWLVGPEGQKILSEGNNIIPNQTSYAYSDEYVNGEARACKNTWAAVYSYPVGDMGDWAYFDEGSWVTDWAEMLNGPVRRGERTLTDFFTAKVNSANAALGNVTLRFYR